MSPKTSFLTLLFVYEHNFYWAKELCNKMLFAVVGIFTGTRQCQAVNESIKGNRGAESHSMQKENNKHIHSMLAVFKHKLY